MSTRWPSAFSFGRMRSSSSNLPDARQMCSGALRRVWSICSSEKKRKGWLHTLRSCISTLFGPLTRSSPPSPTEQRPCSWISRTAPRRHRRSSHHAVLRLARQPATRPPTRPAAQQEGAHAPGGAGLITSRLSSSLMLRSSAAASAADARACARRSRAPPPPPPPTAAAGRPASGAAREPLLEAVDRAKIFGSTKLRSAHSSRERVLQRRPREQDAVLRLVLQRASPTAWRRRSSCGGPRRR